MTYATINDLKDELLLLERRRILIQQLIEIYSPANQSLPRPKTYAVSPEHIVDALANTGFDTSGIRKTLANERPAPVSH